MVSQDSNPLPAGNTEPPTRWATLLVLGRGWGEVTSQGVHHPAGKRRQNSGVRVPGWGQWSLTHCRGHARTPTHRRTETRVYAGEHTHVHLPCRVLPPSLPGKRLEA